jgi:hypothetical protein
MCAGSALGLSGIWLVILVIGLPLLATDLDTVYWLPALWELVAVGVLWGVPLGALVGLCVGLGATSSHIRRWRSAFAVGALTGVMAMIVVGVWVGDGLEFDLGFQVLWVGFAGVLGGLTWRLRARDEPVVTSILAG